MVKTTMQWHVFDAEIAHFSMADFTMIGTHTKVMTVQVADGTSETLVSNRRPMYPPIYLSTYLYDMYTYIYICVLSNLILSYSILSYTIFTDPILSYILYDLNLINSYLLYLCIYVSMYLRNSAYLCI